MATTSGRSTRSAIDAAVEFVSAAGRTFVNACRIVQDEVATNTALILRSDPQDRVSKGGHEQSLPPSFETAAARPPQDEVLCVLQDKVATNTALLPRRATRAPVSQTSDYLWPGLIVHGAAREVPAPAGFS
jgi:hypothetical protein